MAETKMEILLRHFRSHTLRATILLCCLAGSALSGSQETPEYDQPPHLVKHEEPAYPEEAYRQGIEGAVLVEFVVSTSGTVRDAQVVKSIPELDQAALECVTQWHFEPAKKDGIPVATRAQTPVLFRIAKPKGQQ